MGGIVDSIGSIFGGGGDDGADAARDAAGIQAQYQREALNYLKQREKLPQQFREGALSQIGGLYGLEGGDAGALQAIQSNPIYQATMGNLPAQEEAILRNQSATGALRTGATDAMLAENQRQNQLQAYQNTLGGLQGLANLPSNAANIASQTAGIGQTLGQGIVGAEQSRQAGQQAGMGNLMGLGQLGLAAFSAFCDPALKDNVEKVGESEGYNIYRWTWNDKAANLSLYGEGYGPMADEIEAKEPERITHIKGYKFVRARNGY